MTIRLRILLTFTLLTLAATASIGFLVYWISGKTIDEEARAFLTATNTQKKLRIGQWLRDSTGNLSYLAQHLHYYEGLETYVSQYDDREAENRPIRKRVLAQNLMPMLAEGTFIELMIIRNTDGMVVISTDQRQEGKLRADRTYFLQGQEHTYVQTTFYSMTLMEPTMVIATPLMSRNGSVYGVLAGRLDLGKLSAIVIERSGRKQSEDSYLVNRQNLFISEPLYGKNYALRKTIYTEGVKLALAGESGTGRYPDYREVMVIGAYSFLADQNLALITEIDEEDYLQPLRRLQIFMLGIGSAMIVLAALISWKSAQLILQPLDRLMQAVQRLDGGNLEFTDTIAGNHEIARLSTTFQVMVARLKTTLVSRDTLEQEVQVRRQTEKDLQAALEQLGQSNRELEQFAYIASHDLQEPLRMVSSYVQLLAERYRGQLDDKADKFISYAVEGAQRMQILIEDLLSLSRVTTRGRDFTPIDSNKLVETAIKNLEQAINQSGAVISCDRLPELIGDRGQLIQVFQNLIANAIKFRTEAVPEIRISATEQADHWLFSVTDNGIGLDIQYADKIFVIFKRLHTREEYEGTGIGLAICKRIIERHGGSIGVRSIPGSGATFFFTIPKKKDSTDHGS